jgi:hypothetical protein
MRKCNQHTWHQAIISSKLKPSIGRSFFYCVGELHKYCFVLSMFSLLYIGSSVYSRIVTRTVKSSMY